MDFNPNSASNAETARDKDKWEEALKTRLAPLLLLCLVTVLYRTIGFFLSWGKPTVKKGPLETAVENLAASAGFDCEGVNGQTELAFN